MCGRHCLAADILVTWLLQSSCPALTECPSIKWRVRAVLSVDVSNRVGHHSCSLQLYQLWVAVIVSRVLWSIVCLKFHLGNKALRQGVQSLAHAVPVEQEGCEA